MSNSGLADIHLAAQYLAAAGISFLEKKDDDSHTNLGYSEEQQQFYSRPLNNSGDYLALNLKNFSLEWISSSGSQDLPLDLKNHGEILEWLRTTTKHYGLKSEYQFSFLYDLHYAISDDYVFNGNMDALQLEIDLRGRANKILSRILFEYSMESEIRIWPHHFDTGAIAQYPGSLGLSVGLGLAIPDSLVNQYYFYISGYKDHEGLGTDSFTPLSHGQWLNDGFKGGILPANYIDESTVFRFFREAVQSYLP